MKLRGKVALVTGGARGLGRAYVLHLARLGADIVVNDIDLQAAREYNEELTAPTVMEEVEAMDCRALGIQADVTVKAEVDAMVEQTLATFGRLDILVCCAGILGKEATFLEQSAAQFDKVLKINLYGIYYAHQAAIPHMLKGGWGRCLSITSGARHGATNQVPYGVSKGAVYAFVAALGNAYPKQNVFVNGVEPGRALTDMVVPRFTPEFLANPGNPIGRYSDAEEVAEVVEFLCSERNTYTTGAVWSVKGQTG